MLGYRTEIGNLRVLAPRWEYPSLPLVPASALYNLKAPPAHRYRSSAVWRLTVGNKKAPTSPVDILDSQAVEFSSVSHSCVSHQPDNILKELQTVCPPS